MNRIQKKYRKLVNYLFYRDKPSFQKHEQYKAYLFKFNQFMASYMSTFIASEPNYVLSDLNHLSARFLETFMSSTDEIFLTDGELNTNHLKYLSDKLGILNKSFKEWRKYIERLELL